jgi:membrane protease YdiL (CAAX protease family)
MPWDFWLLFLILSVVIPWRGRLRLRQLLARPAGGTKEKLVLYGSTIAFQWLLAGVVAWRAIARGLSVADLGLVGPFTLRLLLVTLAGAALVGTFQWFNLRRVGRMSGPIPDFMRKLTERVLPVSAIEFGPYAALAITAGVCEEFLYRGFAMAALSRAGLEAWMVVLVTSVLFGLAHTYQGRSGILGTGLMGVVFGVGRIWLQSLAPVVVWHATVDVVAGIAAPRYLLQQPPEH